MIAFDRGEALRYLGYKAGQQPDEAVEQRLLRCVSEMQNAVQPKSVFRAFPLAQPAEGTLELAGVTVCSKNLSRNLKGCGSIYLMAVTQSGLWRFPAGTPAGSVPSAGYTAEDRLDRD